MHVTPPITPQTLHFIFEKAGATRARGPPPWLEKLGRTALRRRLSVHQFLDTNVGVALESVFSSQQHYSAGGIHVSVVDGLHPRIRALGVYPVIKLENKLRVRIEGAAILLVSKAFLEDPAFSHEVKAAVVKHHVLRLQLMKSRGFNAEKAAKTAERMLSEYERRRLREASGI